MGELASQIPLQRIGTRKDIAEASVFLASCLSSYITGSVIIVDGGCWLTQSWFSMMNKL